MHLKDIEKALGRIQWATAACPLAKSMLQPLWAWKMATTTVGKPPKVVRMLAFMLRFLFNTPFVQYSPYLPKSSWWGCSDASASDDGLAFVGGWCSNTVEPDKKEVYWFHEQIHVEEYPWGVRRGGLQLWRCWARSSSVTLAPGPSVLPGPTPGGQCQSGQHHGDAQPWLQEALHGGDLPAPHPWLLAGGQPCAP